MKTPPPSFLTRMILVRHGSTAANEMQPYILQGSEMNGPLTETGRRQAGQLADYLADFQLAAIYSSPMNRAVETASYVAKRHGLTIETIPELRECSVGTWEGLDWESIRTRDADNYKRVMADPEVTPHPGGESFQDVIRRVEPALTALFEKHRGENILVMAHNIVNRVYLASLAGLELKHARKLRQGNCGLNVIHHAETGPELVTMNSMFHID